MPPRRKSRKTAAVAEADNDADNASQGTNERQSPPPASKLTLGGLLSDIDVNTLGEIFPYSPLDSPTPDSVIASYKLILELHGLLKNAGAELQTCRIQAETKDVDLETALAENVQLRSQMDDELGSLRVALETSTKEKDSLGQRCDELMSELIGLKSASSLSGSELEVQRKAAEEAEREKRNLLGIISRLEEEAVHCEEEIGRLREEVKTYRSQKHELETTVRDLRSSLASAEFKIETADTRLQLAKEENARINGELNDKLEEFANFRRDKHTDIVQLQSKLDSLSQTHAQTTSQLRSLQTSHETQSHRLSKALQEVQDLTGQLADQEAKYSSEAANLRRLVEVMEKREEQAKSVVKGIEKDWESIGSKAAAREQKLREALSEEQERAASLERQVEDLKAVLERVNAGELPLPSHDRSGSFVHSGGLSQNIALISRMQKGGKSFTEVYADYVRVQDELRKKTAENERLDRTLTEVLGEIEERAPLITELRKDHERIQAESVQLASQLTQALQDRDGYISHIKELKRSYEDSQRERQLLQDQLRDASLQVQVLLKEVARRDDPDLPSDVDLEGIDPAEDVESVISNRLVLFRSIGELQEKNLTLLKVTRELGAKLEAEEKDYKERLDSEQNEAIREAHEAIQALQDQLARQERTHQAAIQAYTKERESLRALLTRYERSDPLNAPDGVFRSQISSFDALNPSLNAPIEQISDFESYRQEMAADSLKLREEVSKYQHEASRLSVSLSKANAKIDYLNERQRMAQDQFNRQARDSESLNKRNQELQEQCTRLEIACTRTSEELSIANSHIERLRNENINLRSEKQIWENVQSRLEAEVKDLTTERERMSSLLFNVQRVHTDLDNSYDNERKRFDSQVQSLENQIQDLRSQLSRERDSSRQSTLQKDVEAQEMRGKLDNAVEELSKTRESLARSETSCKHLQERLGDLEKQVQSSEEKLAVYERRTGSSSTSIPSSVDNGSISQKEIAELRAALKVAELDLATERGHVEQYKKISAASEEAMMDLQKQFDEYKISVDRQVATFESLKSAAEERVSLLQEELNRANEKAVELQKSLDAERETFAQDKRTLEDAIVDITNAESSSRADSSAREVELRQLEERARIAEEKYSQEVMAHAESMKTASSLKQEVSNLRTALREKATAADTATEKLTLAELSWDKQKKFLQDEIELTKARCRDLIAQRETLHQHLESVENQASRISQIANATTSGSHGQTSSADNDIHVAELRSVVSYLRKEKEIVDLQFEISKQENARLKSQVEHVTKSLDETRATLSTEREQAAQALENSTEHTQLLEKINQLNILRESNATLRADRDAQARRAKQLETSLAQMSSELEPFKEQVRVLRAELDERERQMRRLEDENKQWKERNSQLLTKYDRIDPSDVQALRDEIEDLQIDVRKYEEAKLANEKELAETNKKLEEATTALTESRGKYQKLLDESRTRLGSLNARIGDLNRTIQNLQKQVKDLTAERDQLLQQQSSSTANDSSLLEAKGQLESILKEKEGLQTSLTQELERMSSIKAELSGKKTIIDALNAEKDRLVKEKQELADKLATSNGSNPSAVGGLSFETEKNELQKALSEAQDRAKAAEERANTLSEEVKNIKMQNEKFQVRIAENQRRLQAEARKQLELAAKYKQEQEEAVKAATEKLRADLQATGSNTPNIDQAKLDQELKSLRDQLEEAHKKELQAAIEKAKSDALSRVAPEAVKLEQKTAEEQEQALKAATERGRMEVAAKLRLKDSMLLKAQNNVKHLEAQIKAWRDAGIIPVDAPLLPTSSTTTAKPAAPAASNTPVVAPAPLPRKPSVAIASQPVIAQTTSAATDVSTRGRPIQRGMRGTARGAASIRGAARGGAPVAVVPSGESSAASSSGVSIMGAAGKRAREEADGADSLAKRIKPAEIANKPVALRRDRIPPATQAPP